VMSVKRIEPYLANAFWLLAPLLLMNLVFTKDLPQLYRSDAFQRETPRWIWVMENLFRTPVMLLPLVMRPRFSSPSQKLGLGLYGAGAFVYCLSWWLQIAHPQSTWSRSLPGFTSLAYTPLLWLAGIGLIGDSLTIPKLRYPPLICLCLAGMFGLFHTIDAWSAHRLDPGR